MTRRGTALCVLGVALVAAGAAVFFYTQFEQVTEEIRLPPRGQAAYNPLYALERSLAEHGVVVESRATLDLRQTVLQPGDGLVLYADPRTLLPAQTEALLGWVERGGHLVVGMPPGDPDRPVPLLQRLGVIAKDVEGSCERLAATRTEPAVDMLCGGQRFDPPSAGAHAVLGDAERGYAYARLVRGRGTADVFSTLDFLDNRALETRANWRLAHQALAPGFGGRVRLIYAGAPSLWLLIVREGWPALIGLGCLIAAWAAMRGQRFGPLAADPPLDRRSLVEHVQAAGDYVYRRGAAHALHRALFERVLARLRGRDPMALALEGEARALHLAARAALDPERVRRALHPPEKFNAASFRDAMATLIQLGTRS